MRYVIQNFLNIKSATFAGFSPDASKILVQSNLPETAQLYHMPSSGGAFTQITSYDEPTSGGYLPTSDEVLILRDEGGNERLQIYFLDRVLRT